MSKPNKIRKHLPDLHPKNPPPPVTQVDILDYLEWVRNLIVSKAKQGLCLVDIPSGEDEDRWMEGWLIGYEAGIAIGRQPKLTPWRQNY